MPDDRDYDLHEELGDGYFSEEEEFNRAYYGNLTEHVCEGCDAKFKASTMRGPLAYCD